MVDGARPGERLGVRLGTVAGRWLKDSWVRRAWMARETVVHRQGEDYAYEDEQGEQRGARLLREVLEVGILTLMLFIVVHLLVQNYRVDGPSMTPTLINQEYILVDKAQYIFQRPQRGDIIVFAFPKDTSQDFVKRDRKSVV